jgi:hypothetical protein
LTRFFFFFCCCCCQVIELSKQNTDLEEEALALEQKLGEAEASVEKGEKRLAELSAQLASGANGSKEMREKVKEKEVRAHGVTCVSVEQSERPCGCIHHCRGGCAGRCSHAWPAAPTAARRCARKSRRRR